MRWVVSGRAFLWLGVLVASGPGFALPPPGVGAPTTPVRRVEALPFDPEATEPPTIRQESGIASGPQVLSGPTIDVWYGDVQRFGTPGLGQRWVNVLGRVTDPDGIRRLQYSLNGGPLATLALGSDNRRLYFPGDFDVELDPTFLLGGANTLLLRAEDSQGALTERTVTVLWERQPWPLPYAVDWSAAASVPAAVQVVDGRWALVAGGVRIQELAYDRLLLVGDLDWLDYEIVVPFTVHGYGPGAFTPTSGMPGFGVIMRWTGHTDTPVVCPQPHCGWMPNGTSAWYWWNDAGGYNGDIGGSVLDPSARTLSFGTAYLLKMRVETVPGTGSLYKWRVWRADEAEPLRWNGVGYGDPRLPRGAALIVAHHTDATIGNIRVAPLPDVRPPDAPQGLAAEPTSAFGVRVSWLAAQDDFQVVEYRVYRDGVLAGRTTGTSFSDQPLAAATHYRYTVTALDEAGHESAPSLPADTWTPPAPPGPRCGDGTRSAGEQCDDGNTTGGDGCSALCLVEAATSNALGNGDFALGQAPWYFYTNGSGTFSVLDGGARLQIAVQGTNVQLSQNPVALRGNTRYRLSFRGRSTDGSDVEVSLFKTVSPYTNYGLSRVFDLTPFDQTFAVDFVTTPGDKTDARFMLWLAPYDRNGGEYAFDDVLLEEWAAKCGNGAAETGEACDDGDLDNTDGCLNDCRAAACGDGWRDASSEACDDGNRTDGDGCSAACLSEHGCGDGTLDAGESCDDGNHRDDDACVGNCVFAACGDRFVRAGVEECDDGNTAGGDGCSGTCEIEPYCGDGAADPGEACDDGNVSNSDACVAGCRVASCGDGFVRTGVEGCDDGNAAGGDGCSATCTVEPFCGDGAVAPGEGCDDGNASNTDACVAGCRVASCGDGFVRAGVEGCDDGNTAAGDGCSATCVSEARPPNLVRNGDFAALQTDWFFYSDASAVWSIVAGASEIAVSVSGNNVQLSQVGVALEPGRRYRLSFRGRSSGGEDVEVSLFKNVAPYTGYGLRQVFDLTPAWTAFSFEFSTSATATGGARLMFWLAPYDRAGARFGFDDVELVRVDGTVAPVCGDGRVDAGEACDDGNTSSADGCVAGCRVAACGDAFVRTGVEGCDDGNTVSGDGCSATCAVEPYCGDGALAPGEGCDDGNASNTDGCVAGCRVARCGDGFVRAGVEGCDDGNAVSGDGCSAACLAETGPNAVTNGDFSGGGASWFFYSNGGATWRIVAGESEIVVSSSGSNVQLSHEGIAVAGGARYRLRFRGRSSAGQDVDVSLFKTVSPYTSYGLSQHFDLTTADRTFEVEFTTPAGDRNDGRLMFWLAPYDDPGAKFWFDDVELRRIDAGS